MNELITEFIGEQFTSEAIDEIKKSIELFDVYNALDYEDKMIELLMDGNLTSTDQKDGIVKIINDTLDLILEAHTISVYTNTPIYIKNELLSALFLVQHLEDSRPFLIALESQDNDDEILAYILSELSELDVTDVLTAIASFRPAILKQLKVYLQSKDTDSEITGIEKHIKILKELEQFCEKEDLIGLKLTKSGMLLGQNLETYAKFISDLDVKKQDDLTAHILSLLYMTPEGLNSPILAYRQKVHIFFNENDATAITGNTLAALIENKLALLVANFNEYQKALNEKIRLSQVSS